MQSVTETSALLNLNYAKQTESTQTGLHGTNENLIYGSTGNNFTSQQILDLKNWWPKSFKKTLKEHDKLITFSVSKAAILNIFLPPKYLSFAQSLFTGLSSQDIFLDKPNR